jgi:metal-responsive CopG/Arc/MetJ family transcriptional regulator
MKKEKVYKVKTGITINNDLIELMDEYLTEINNLNRSKYVEKLIKEDLEKRGKKIDENF